MSAESRKAQVGDRVSTDFSGKFTDHRIVERVEGFPSQSRVMFKVTPNVPKSTGAPIDADWFEVLP